MPHHIYHRAPQSAAFPLLVIDPKALQVGTQGHLWLHIQFEESLSYLRPCLKATAMTKRKKEEKKETENIFKNFVHGFVHNSSIQHSQNVSTTKICVHRWMDKESVTGTHSGILLSWRKGQSTLNIFKCVWVFCLHVCLCTTLYPVPSGQKKASISWDWSYRQLRATM